MNTRSFSSRLLENAVNELSRLPGVGKKTALRLALFILKQENDAVHRLATAISSLRENAKYCTVCHNISDSDICAICSDARRDHSQVCVVESVRDVMAMEKTQQFRGVYHVLGGVISPMDGIGPDDLNIPTLIDKVRLGNVTELIFALNATMEGDTTSFYIYRKLTPSPVIFSTIARGISVGDDLEYADEVTLGRSIINRLPFEKTL